MTSDQSGSNSSSSSTPNSLEIQQTLRAFFSGAFKDSIEKVPSRILSSIQSNQLTLFQLIRQLGEQLTSEDEELRSKAVELLSDLVLALTEKEKGSEIESSVEQLDRQAVRTLSSFFSSKLQDGETVAASISQKYNSTTAPVPASAPSTRQLPRDGIPFGTEMLAASLKALIRLAARKEFGAESAKEVAESLITNFQPRSHPQSIRFILYSLLDVLIARCRTALKTMGDQFLSGYVKLVEGEKDPRNLMYLFAIDRVLLIEFDLSTEMVEKFFDITFCYFPITFKPPPDDPYGITQLDLKVSLRSCLAAHPGLAPHAMPLLLEKLSASSGGAKRDTLETLELALPIYGKAATLANQKKLWEGLKIEIFHATDDATSICAQRTLVSFLRTIYQGQENPDGIAPKVVAECLSELKSPDKVLASPACSALVCCVRACEVTSYLAITGLVEQQLELFQDPDEVPLRASILNHLGTLFRTMRETYERKDGLEKVKVALEYDDERSGNLKFDAPSTGTSSKISESTESSSISSNRSYAGDRNPLSSHLSKLISALSNGLNSPSYRSSALFCLLHASHISTLLSFDELRYLVSDTNRLLLLSHVEDENSRKGALETLREIGKMDANIIEDNTLPMLFEQLPDRMELLDDPNAMQIDGRDEDVETEESSRRSKVRLALGALSRLCGASPALLDMLVVRVCTKLDLCCSPSISSSQDASPERLKKIREDNVGYARGLILTLQTVFEERAALASTIKDPKKEESVPKIGFGLSKTSSAETKDVLLLRYAKDLPPRLCSLVLASSIRWSLNLSQSTNESIQPVGTDSSLLLDIASLLSLLVRSLSTPQQEFIKSWLYPIFINGEFNSNLTSFRSLEEVLTLSRSGSFPEWKFNPLCLNSDEAQKNSLILLASFLVSSNATLSLPDVSLSELSTSNNSETTLNWFSHLLKLTCHSTSNLQLEGCLALLESCSNKQVGALGMKLPTRVDEILTEFWEKEFQNSNLDESSTKNLKRRENAIKAWFSVARGFVVRVHSKGEEMVERVRVSLFERSDSEGENQDEMEMKVMAAKWLGMVAKEGGNLRKENGAVVRLLHRQRFFSFILPKLIQGHKASAESRLLSSTSTSTSTPIDPSEHLYLLSLSSLLPSLPHSLLSASSSTTQQSLLSSLLPLLLRMLSLPSSSARTSAAESIGMITILGAKERANRSREDRERTLLPASGRVEKTHEKENGNERVLDGLDVLREQFSGIIKRLLNNVEPDEWNIPSTRVATLQTLCILAKCYPPRDSVLHSEAKGVIRTLGGLPPLSQPGLMSSGVQTEEGLETMKKRQKKRGNGSGIGIDDPKRRVRLEAVEARDAWFYRESVSGGDSEE